MFDSHEPIECASLSGSLVGTVERHKHFSDEIAEKVVLEALAERPCAAQNVIAMLAAVSALDCSNGVRPAKSDDEKQAGAKGMRGEP